MDQAPLSMGFSRQEYWTVLPCLPPGDLPDPGMEPVSPALADRFFITEAPEKLNNKTGHPEGGGPEFSLRPRKLCMYCS